MDLNVSEITIQQQQLQHATNDQPQHQVDHLQLEGLHKEGKLKNKEKKKKKKKKRPPHKSKMITGYIIYASEIRKEIIKQYPDRDFGFISKIVGNEWKNLPQSTKAAYERRAQEQNVKSKAIAAEALELKKLADAAEERAKEQQAASQSYMSSTMPNCNGYASNGHTYSNHHLARPELSLSPFSSDSQGPVQQMQLQHTQYHMQQSTPLSKNGASQQPLQIIQQQQQATGTTVQYCNNNGNMNTNALHPNNYSTLSQSQTPLQRNNIVYRKPATVRLRPKDGTTQTEPIVWVPNPPRKPLKFSQKFLDYLKTKNYDRL